MRRRGKRGGAAQAGPDNRKDPDVSAESRHESRQLPVLVHRAREALSVHFRKAFLSYGLTDLQWRVLRILSQSGEISIPELADRSCLMGRACRGYCRI